MENSKPGFTYNTWKDNPLYKPSAQGEIGYNKPNVPWNEEVLQKRDVRSKGISALLHWAETATPAEKAAAKFDMKRWHGDVK